MVVEPVGERGEVPEIAEAVAEFVEAVIMEGAGCYTGTAGMGLPTALTTRLTEVVAATPLPVIHGSRAGSQPLIAAQAGLMQSQSQQLLRGLRVWVEVGGVAPLP